MSIGLARARVNRRLVHTYTLRQEGTGTDEGAWGDAGQDLETAVQGPCLFQDTEEYVQGPNGIMAVRKVVLYVRSDDQIKSGDEVTSVTGEEDDGTEVVLLEGPVRVRTANPANPTGPAVYHVVTFEEPRHFD